MDQRPGTVAEIVTDTNRQLVDDVEDSGRFMTLFFADIDCWLSLAVQLGLNGFK
ncbi:MAG: hypothetical protein QNL14_07265 [Deltaproteobacteria bacterium]|nr:hypothetical protein [Deltaproteobacteria bacterium]